MSFAKIHQSIYDGSLRDDWKALITFKILLVLADREGNVDVTLRALHHRTGVPMDILESGIAHLEAVDADSRTPDQDGRRIVRLDTHRAWGWKIVNYVKYRDSKDLSNAQRQRRWREKQVKTTGQSTNENPTIALRNVMHNVTSESVSDSESSDGGCKGGELPTEAQAIASLMTMGVPEDFGKYVFADWESRGGKDGANIAVPFSKYAKKRWVREGESWRDKTHKGKSEGKTNGTQTYQRNSAPRTDLNQGTSNDGKSHQYSKVGERQRIQALERSKAAGNVGSGGELDTGHRGSPTESTVADSGGHERSGQDDAGQIRVQAS